MSFRLINRIHNFVLAAQVDEMYVITLNHPYQYAIIITIFNLYIPQPCRGDSGGALMQLIKAEYWQLIGVVSFGPSVCAREGIDSNPAIFTKVQYFIPWIVQNAL